jgi:DNA-binding NarL/FixJ family response regulator
LLGGAAIGASAAAEKGTHRDAGADGPVTIVIVEDHTVIAQGLAALLGGTPGFRVLGVYATATDALHDVGRLAPAVALVDFHLPDLDGPDATSRLREASPATQVVILTGSARREDMLRALEAGASGYLLKTEPAEKVISVLRGAARGEFLVAPETVAELLREKAHRVKEQAVVERIRTRITPREREILDLMAKGMDNKSIAHQLGVSVNTVRMHVQNLLGKLDARSKLEAVARAAELGLLER